MNISKEVWKEINDILKKYKIPYTAHWEGENKEVQINLVIYDYFDDGDVIDYEML